MQIRHMDAPFVVFAIKVLKVDCLKEFYKFEGKISLYV